MLRQIMRTPVITTNRINDVGNIGCRKIPRLLSLARFTKITVKS